MAITLPKTLQGEVYTLYIITTLRLREANESIEIHQDVYKSYGHFTDDFLPIIKKNITITNEQRVNTIKTLLRLNYGEALSVVENFLVNNVAYYTEGTVTNGEV